ncbi:DHHW family protein [Viridibacillus arvi]|uniref:DHHW family protein n=1 Tax=Viridibacillus arvi TaxID=263475 RepID=UPI003D08EFC9
MKKGNISEIIHIGCMVGIVIVGFTLFILLPKDNISENEKRQLTTSPSFSVESFFNKSYSKQMDLYVSDTFPFREQFIALNSFYNNAKGIRSGTDEIQIYNIQK